MTDEEQPLRPPDEAYTVAMSILDEWQGHAEIAMADGMQYPASVLGNASSKMINHLIRELAEHQPFYADGSWQCPSCVEMQQIGLSRAAAPCAYTRKIFQILGIQLEDAAPGGLRMIVQDGTEPYVTYAAAELELTYRLPAAQARSHASSVVRTIAGLRRARH